MIQYIEKMYLRRELIQFTAESDQIALMDGAMDPAQLVNRSILVTTNGKAYFNLSQFSSLFLYGTLVSPYGNYPTSFDSAPLSVSMWGIFGYYVVPSVVKSTIAKMVVIDFLNEIGQGLSGGAQSLKFMSMQIKYGTKRPFADLLDQYALDIQAVIDQYTFRLGSHGVNLSQR